MRSSKFGLLLGAVLSTSGLVACSSTPAERADVVEPATVLEPLESAALHRMEEPYPDVSSLTKSSSVVLIGVVSDIASAGMPSAGEDPHASLYSAVYVKPSKVISGKIDLNSEVVLIWETFITTDGRPSAVVIQDGVTVPTVGDELLLFLKDESPDRAKFFGVPLTHFPNTLDGILWVRDGIVDSPLYGENRPSDKLTNRPLDAVIDEITVLAAAEG